MKLREGGRIVRTKGHHVGGILVDVPDGKPMPTDAPSFLGPPVLDTRKGYVCGRRDAVVALLDIRDVS